MHPDRLVVALAWIAALVLGPSARADEAPATGAAGAAGAATPATALCIVCQVRHGESAPEPVRATSVREGVTYSFCSDDCRQAFDADPAAFLPADLPRVAPDFSVRALDGRTRTLADYRGQVLFLDFWATWCAPCVKEMPNIEKLWTERRASGLEVLGVSIDEDAKKVPKFAKSRKVAYPLALDAGSPPAWERYGVRAIPAAFLIDRDGRIVRQWTGRVDAAEVRAAADALLGAAD
jgi:peroxiredoxin/YHS domain-containing protein